MEGRAVRSGLKAGVGGCLPDLRRVSKPRSPEPVFDVELPAPFAAAPLALDLDERDGVALTLTLVGGWGTSSEVPLSRMSRLGWLWFCVPIA